MPEWQTVFIAAGQCIMALVAGFLVHLVVSRLVVYLARRARWYTATAFARALRRPSRLLFPLLALAVALPAIPAMEPGPRAVLWHALTIGFIAVTTWLAAALVDAATNLVLARHDVTRPDNLSARRVHTQALVMERTLVVIIVIVGIAAALMTFPDIRQIGASLLVSAGVAGLALGLAARPVLENIIAGLQLAFTQPIRVDDVVIVEGEWGRIEEITATYVVVKIWDERRLVVPFSQFISKPFQNWTRTSADILGAVFLYADYRLPVDAVRQELERLCESAPWWDRRVCVLQVTDATERTMQLRALVSAADSGNAWELRVYLREALIAFLQREFPDCLPRTRVELAEPEEKTGGR